MKNKKTLSLIMSFVIAITFCCSGWRASAVGATHEETQNVRVFCGFAGGLTLAAFCWMLWSAAHHINEGAADHGAEDEEKADEDQETESL
ncbi:MAG: hypothetical protein LBJ38_02040 [Oscillospiraceae bacterium]|nr:hypothetical protein [Oscillospiraceae bacterium]